MSSITECVLDIMPNYLKDLYSKNIIEIDVEYSCQPKIKAPPPLPPIIIIQPEPIIEIIPKVLKIAETIEVEKVEEIVEKIEEKLTPETRALSWKIQWVDQADPGLCKVPYGQVRTTQSDAQAFHIPEARSHQAMHHQVPGAALQDRRE